MTCLCKVTRSTSTMLWLTKATICGPSQLYSVCPTILELGDSASGATLAASIHSCQCLCSQPGPNACFSLDHGMLRCSKTAYNLRSAAVAPASHGHKQAQLVSKLELH